MSANVLVPHHSVNDDSQTLSPPDIPDIASLYYFQNDIQSKSPPSPIRQQRRRDFGSFGSDAMLLYINLDGAPPAPGERPFPQLISTGSSPVEFPRTYVPLAGAAYSLLVSSRDPRSCRRMVAHQVLLSPHLTLGSTGELKKSVCAIYLFLHIPTEV
jgi:hypothetical protein